MTQTTTDLQVSVSSGLMDSGAYQIAHDLLAGYSGEYFFFQSDSSEYCLILNYEEAEYISTGVYMFGECDYYLLEASGSSSTQYVSFDGNSSGRFLYGQGGGSYAGTYTGSIPLPVVTPPTYKVSFYHDSDGCSVLNSSGYVCYGTFFAIISPPNIKERNLPKNPTAPLIDNF